MLKVCLLLISLVCGCFSEKESSDLSLNKIGNKAGKTEIAVMEDFTNIHCPGYEQRIKTENRIENDHASLEKFSYSVTETMRTSPEQSKGKTDSPIVQRNTETHIPWIAVEFNGGWLLGSDRGEWGGELVYQSNDGKRSILLKRNVRQIFKVGNSIFVFSGFNHGLTQPGEIHRVLWDRGAVKVSRFGILPSSPEAVCFLNDVRVLIEVAYGEAFVLEHGKLKNVRSPRKMTRE